MDQSIIAGIGNIYASEILHRASINPLRTVDKPQKRTFKINYRCNKVYFKKVNKCWWNNYKKSLAT